MKLDPWTPLDELDAACLYRDFPHLNATSEQHCPTCAKTGRYYFDDTWYDCNCQEQLNLHRHYLSAGIGIAYQRLNWSDYEGEAAAAHQVLDWAENPMFLDRGIGLLLWGGFGSGKTMLANLAAKELVRSGCPTFVTAFSQMVTHFSATWKGDDSDREFFHRKFLHSRVLVLDDAAREWRNRSGLSEAVFDSVLRQRVQHGLTTLLTTNQSPDELGRGYGAAILSLLTERSLHIEFTGGDYRRQANKRELEEIRRGWTRPIC